MGTRKINNDSLTKVVIIGAGPAGLAAAYELVKLGNKKFQITIVDKNDKVGGLARTMEYQACLFDIGPHRFFTKNEEVLKLWKAVLGKKLLKVKRLTRMLYKNKLFQYPINLFDVVFKLDPQELISVLFSFLHAKLFLKSNIPITFEEYISKNFGRQMFNIFFKTYTEKVWGIKCDQIAAKWASQRIKNLDLWEIVKNAIYNPTTKKSKSLIDEFYYPVRGAGLMYETLAKKLRGYGVQILLESNVKSIKKTGNKISHIIYVKDGEEVQMETDWLLSSMPLNIFVLSQTPAPTPKVVRAAKKIYFRDHITVNLLVKGVTLFNDNWIYVHDPNVKMARITNYNSMSSAMTNKKPLTALSIEYFAFKNDALWKMKDKGLIDLAVSELARVKLVNAESVIDGMVVRELDSYPVYYTGHEGYFQTVKDHVSGIGNLELIGRGGMFKYNNMDHSIYSGMLAARNIVSNKRLYNTWIVNEDAEYLEVRK